jgi:hypothetical protein
MRGRGSRDDGVGALGGGLGVFFAVLLLGFGVGGLGLALLLAFPAMFATWLLMGRYGPAPPPTADAPDAVQAAPPSDTASRQRSRLRAHSRTLGE